MPITREILIRPVIAFTLFLVARRSRSHFSPQRFLLLYPQVPIASFEQQNHSPREAKLKGCRRFSSVWTRLSLR